MDGSVGKERRGRGVGDVDFPLERKMAGGGHVGGITRDGDCSNARGRRRALRILIVYRRYWHRCLVTGHV